MSAVDDIAAYLAYLKTGGNCIDQIIFDELLNGEEMTATDELRRLLDERGVEWETDRSGNRVMWGRPVDQFHDTMEFKAVDNAMPNGGLNVHICGFTPTQAIEATLGRGTCRNISPKLGNDEFTCEECLARVYGSGGQWFDANWKYHKFNYCPNCGRRVVG